MTAAFSPGDLVYARGREWVALPSPDEEILCLRPLSGSEADVQFLHPALEREPVRHARFEMPDLKQLATQDGARLLSEALRLSLRRGAGPFRSAARVAFEPRAYQLVPLLMALRLPVVRLLIADDVGIGKTIEAGLILRELIDRGEVDRFAVLCPPHLVEQWTGELNAKFDLDAVAVTASSAPRLERGLPPSQTLFDAHPYTVVSLDYIKADRRRDTFARACPKLVVVDEAHACVGTHQSRQQRFELLKRLAEDRERHLLLLTATPHSGDEAAFDRLLSLLDDEFAVASLDSEASRIRLARHFVQRRRIDITGRDWGEERAFPRHETAERAYDLSPEHRAFHDAVLDYCFGVVEGAGPDQRRRRLAFWGTLALMRCVGSSPAAALSALRNRLAADPDRLEEQVFDDDADEADALDVEPAPGLEEAGPLAQPCGAGRGPDPGARSEARSDGQNPEAAHRRRRQPGRLLPLHRDRRSRRGGSPQSLPEAAHRGGDRRADPRGPARAGGRHGRSRAAVAGCYRLPVRRRQSAAAVRYRHPLRSVLEPDAPSAARGPGRPLRPAGGIGPLGAALLARQRHRRRGARCHPAQGRGDPEGDRGDGPAARGARRGHQRADERGHAAQGPGAAAQP